MTATASVKDLIRGVLAIDPAAPAVDIKGQWRTFGDIGARIAKLDTLFAQLGLGADTRVALFINNRFEPLCGLLSIVTTDRCVVTINPVYPDTTLAEDIKSLRPPVVLAEQHQWDRAGIKEAVAAIGAAGIVLTGEDAEPARFVAGLDKVTGKELDVTRPGVVIEMLTSGTTGKPKRVPLTRRAFQQGFESALVYDKSRDGDFAPKLRSGTQILHAPMSHIGGMWHVLNAIAAGRKIALIERFNVPDWRDAVVRHRPKSTGAPPAALKMILEANLPKADLESVVAFISGTAPCDPEIIDTFLERYGIPVLSTYGATEFAGSVAGWTLADFKAHWTQKRGSAGRLQPGVEGRVVNPETGEILPPGQEGVLELKSKQLADPDTWLRTTDRAVLDADNFLFVKGRADNAIIRGGFKVHPDDVVNALQSHPAVREAAVVGVKDARLGQVPAAAIITRAGHTPPSEDELRAFLRDKLSPYQIPTRFKFVADVPRTSSLKPSMPGLVALFETEDA